MLISLLKMEKARQAGSTCAPASIGVLSKQPTVALASPEPEGTR
jgi:hypothetical protein